MDEEDGIIATSSLIYFLLNAGWLAQEGASYTTLMKRN